MCQKVLLVDWLWWTCGDSLRYFSCTEPPGPRREALACPPPKARSGLRGDRQCACESARGRAGGSPAAAAGLSGGRPLGRRRLPVGRILEVEDSTVGAGAEVHGVCGVDGAIQVRHRAEVVPRRVHEQPAAEASLSQPAEQSGAGAAQARAEALPAPAAGPAVWPRAPARRGGR